MSPDKSTFQSLTESEAASLKELREEKWGLEIRRSGSLSLFTAPVFGP
jgi:hypothetical protein